MSSGYKELGNKGGPAKTTKAERDRWKKEMKRKEEETGFGVFRRNHTKSAMDFSQEQVFEALIEGASNVAKAAQILDCGRPELSDRIKTEPELMEYQKEAKQCYDDMVDLRLKAIIADPDHKSHLQAVQTYLRAQVEGYEAKQEVTGKDGVPIGVIVAPVRALNAEEWAKQNEAS